MTGFGRATASQDGREVTVEIKTVNHRYLDLSFRMPRSFASLEDRLRKWVGEQLERGKVDVYINYRNIREDHAQVCVDTALALSYQKAIAQLSEASCLSNTLSLTQLAGYPQVLTVLEAEEDEEAVAAVLHCAVTEALKKLKKMRAAEGEQLKRDLLAKADAVETLVKTIETAAPQVEQAGKERLMQKMQEYLEADESLKQRVLMEAAILADKHAIDEELVRLFSHIRQFRTTAEEENPVGRKLDFIVQEMNREINTIGSKANDAQIGSSVIQCKSELEKMREQVQNIE